MGEHSETAAVITGGSQGLGFAVAERLVADGCCKIMLVGRNVSKGEDAAKKLRDHGCTDAYFHQADLSDADVASHIIDVAVEKLGFVNSLANCAADTSREKVLETTANAFDKMMAVNARAPMLLIQALARHLVKCKAVGSVVNIGSVAAICRPSELMSYSTSKAALANITCNLAHTLRKHRIRVNCINLGWMDTPAESVVQKEWHGQAEDWLQEVERKQPFGSLVKTHQVARQISLFLSPHSGIVTGSVMHWDQHVLGGNHGS